MNNNFYTILIFILSFIINVSTMIKLIHVFQLQNYNIDQQIIWYKKNYKLYIPNFILLLLVIIQVCKNYDSINVLIILDFIVLLLLSLPKKQKKELVYTNRVKRQIGFCIIIFIIPIVIYFILGRNAAISSTYFVTAVSPIIVFICLLILRPIEDNIKYKYIKLAKDKILSMSNLSVIGITGSFGKTSVKNYVFDLMTKNYNTCMTPESYNTTMGNTITINDTLKSYDDIYISEMGARRVGDIKEICDTVLPDSCIITEVGEQHLDTFKNIENIVNTKFELVDAVLSKIKSGSTNKVGNFILVNGDNDLIVEKIKTYTADEQKYFYRYGLNQNNNFYAENIKIDADGTIFNFVANTENNKNSFQIKTKLIGSHNIVNLVGAIAMAYLYNVDKDDIVLTVSNIKQVSHRLELIKLSDNNIILDDAYNSNYKGFKSAVDTLSSFDKELAKIIITPGIVELGDRQADINSEVAKYAGKVCDYAFVIGKANKDALLKGFNSAYDMKKENIFYYDNFNDAMAKARSIASLKKVILIENDLTDNY